MPRERKRRGRREEARQNKRKHDEADPEEDESSKRFKGDVQDGDDAELPTDDVAAGDDFIAFNADPSRDQTHPETSDDQAPGWSDEQTEFHGLLTPEEQEYYSSVNEKIVADDFESPEDKALFVDAVHRETQGKELKVASSQSCSRYLEKILMLSTADQLRTLFHKFLGNLTYLVRHRFGSHCCERLFLEAAKHVGEQQKDGEEKELPSLEEMFLSAADELGPNVGFLLTDRFASHTLRVLFLILSGEALDDESTMTILASKKKEVPVAMTKSHDADRPKRRVPKSFRKALQKLIENFVSTIDSTYLRALATHPTGNPVLQLLLRLELAMHGKNQPDVSLYRKLLPEEGEDDENSETAKFISGLLYDPVGSHLVEGLVQNLAGKAFKKVYRTVLKPRLGSMVKNDTASYVAIKTLERLGKDDLAEAKTSVLPEFSTLLARRRFAVVKVIVERCVVRHVDLQEVAQIIQAEYGEPSTLLPGLLGFSTAAADQKLPRSTEADEPRAPTAAPKTDVHASLLAQAMLHAPGPVGSLVHDGLLALDGDALVAMCRDPAASRLVQNALAPTRPGSGAGAGDNQQFRRRFVPRFYGQIVGLAQHLTGSYVVDALWSATDNLHFMKERLAGELAGDAGTLRESPFGRNVWKNWSMELYLRRPAEWRALAKDKPEDKTDKTETKGVAATNVAPDAPSKPKSAIELARERHAKKTSQAHHPKRRAPATSANAIAVVRSTA
jgi:nucleolar protein 9